MTGIQIRTSKPDETEKIKALLGNNSLPTADLDHATIQFFVAYVDQHLAGVIGLERYGSHGFLRSFAVEPEFRNRKIGEALFNHLINYCAAEHMHNVHLLTNTAESWFAKHGFIRTDRHSAPADIQSTTEFSQLCPSSSAYMVRKLSNQG